MRAGSMRRRAELCAPDVDHLARELEPERWLV